MIKRFKKNIIYKVLSLYLKIRRKDKVIDIKKSFLASKKILIILPSSKEQFEIALSFLPKIKNVFKKRKIIYIIPASFQNLFKSHFYGNYYFYQDKDISFFQLPRKKFIKLLKKENFDITICLNPDFDLFCAYTCIKTDAKLRIGLYDEKMDDYLNFQIKKEDDKLLGEQYNCLVKYLNMILNTV